MSDVEDNDELPELPSSDPFRTAEIQEVSKCCGLCNQHLIIIVIGWKTCSVVVLFNR